MWNETKLSWQHTRTPASTNTPDERSATTPINTGGLRKARKGQPRSRTFLRRCRRSSWFVLESWLTCATMRAMRSPNCSATASRLTCASSTTSCSSAAVTAASTLPRMKQK